MDMYPKYLSKFGYQTGDGDIDSYGVNHSGFSLRDEIEYQYAREKRENQLKEQYNAQGITSNYPQYGKNFWGNPANNYGFGLTNIASNIANLPKITPIPQAMVIPQTQPQQQTVLPQKQTDVFDILNAKNNMKALLNVIQGYHQVSPQRLNDKYKHSVLSCIGAQGGIPSTIATAGLGVAKEIYDIVTKIPNAQKYGGYGAIITDSWRDLQADANGLIQGYNNPTGNCYHIMRNYYSPTIKQLQFLKTSVNLLQTEVLRKIK